MIILFDQLQLFKKFTNNDTIAYVRIRSWKKKSGCEKKENGCHIYWAKIIWNISKITKD